MNAREVIKQLFVSSRPISWINTAYPFGATYLFFTHSVDLTFVLGTLFFLVPYNLAMYGINDVFDYESDLRNPRKGGIEGALLDPKLHRITLWASVLTCAPFVAYLFFVGRASATPMATNAMLAFALFTVVAYSAKGLRFKEKPVLDSLTSASHFVNPMLYAAVLTGHWFTDPVLMQSWLAFVCWGAASHAFGAVQDVRADREAGIGSIATAFGARLTTRLAFALYALAGVLMLSAGWPSALAAIAALPYLVILVPHLKITDATCETANRGWRRFIWLNYFAGFVITMLLIASSI
ncbi:MAG: hypothetical protein RLZZ164_493 [Actinomycetota bacterium]